MERSSNHLVRLWKLRQPQDHSNLSWIDDCTYFPFSCKFKQNKHHPKWPSTLPLKQDHHWNNRNRANLENPPAKSHPFQTWVKKSKKTTQCRLSENLVQKKFQSKPILQKHKVPNECFDSFSMSPYLLERRQLCPFQK